MQQVNGRGVRNGGGGGAENRNTRRAGKDMGGVRWGKDGMKGEDEGRMKLDAARGGEGLIGVCSKKDQQVVITKE